MGSHVQGPRPRDRVGSSPVVCEGALGPETRPLRFLVPGPLYTVELSLVRLGVCRLL